MKKHYRIILFLVMIVILGWFTGNIWYVKIMSGSRNHAVILPPQYEKIAESFSIIAEDGVKISGTLLHSLADFPVSVVIIAHGIGDDRNAMLQRADLYLENQIDVCLFDFRAHGESISDYCTFGWLEKYDVLAVHRYLQSKQYDKQGFHGVSLGAAAGILAAQYSKFSFMIFESPFDTLENTFKNRIQHRLKFLPPDFVFKPAYTLFSFISGASPEKIAPIEYAGFVSCPVLHMAGDSEFEVSAAQTRDLFDSFAAMDKRLFFFKGLGHKDFLKKDESDYKTIIAKFLHYVPENRSNNDFDPDIRILPDYSQE